MTTYIMKSPFGEQTFDTAQEAWSWAADRMDEYARALDAADLPLHQDTWEETRDEARAMSLAAFPMTGAVYSEQTIWTVHEDR